jgi:hypothetical protein
MALQALIFNAILWRISCYTFYLQPKNAIKQAHSNVSFFFCSLSLFNKQNKKPLKSTNHFIANAVWFTIAAHAAQTKKENRNA